MWRVVLLLLCGSAIKGELFTNPGLEGSLSDWSCGGGCTLETSSDSHSGAQSAKVSGRSADWNGLEQFVDLESDGRYKVTAYVKLLNLEEGAMYQRVKMVVACKKETGSGRYFSSFGEDPFVRLDTWTKIGGVAKLPQDKYGAGDCKVYVNVVGATVNYLVDDASLVLIPDNPNIVAEAQARIEAKKVPIQYKMTGIEKGLYSVEIHQDTIDFPLGSVVGAEEIVDTEDPSNVKYQEVYYDNFNWGVLGNKLKWAAMEKSQGVIDYDTPRVALEALKSHGIKVRGHNVFWGVLKDSNIQPWVQALEEDNDALYEAIVKRVQDVVPFASEYVDHWDVNNENLHGDWYEQAFQYPNVTMDMFEGVRQYDDNAKLYLNDYGIFTGGLAMGIRNQGEYFKEAGVPIHGIGIQGHMKSEHVDLETLQAKLDLIAEAGLPILITELSIEEVDADVKAGYYRDCLTLFYGHPSVEGIILWGFWDGRLWTPDSKMFEGPDVTPNAAGLAYQELYHNTWRSHDKVWWGQGDAERSRTGFQGNYTLTVNKWKQPLATSSFSLGENGIAINVDLDGEGNPTITYSDIEEDV